MYCDHHSPYRELREKAGTSTLYVGRLRTAMCEVFKLVNDICPVYLKTHFILKDKFSETRAAMPLNCGPGIAVPECNSVKFGERSFNYEGVFLCNNLENTYKLSKSVKEFKGQILRWNGPLCRYNFIMRGQSTVLQRVKSSHVLRNIFM